MTKSEIIKNEFLQNGFSLTNEQAQAFEKYYDFLIQENEKYNLTAITSFEDVVTKHFVDSALAFENFSGKVLDVGSGAGFPGVVLAILNPKLQITLVDSLNKRINFLNEVIKLLGLKNVTALHSRVEDLKEKETYDVVTARAVAHLPTLVEYLAPFAKVGGKCVIYKGAEAFEEVESAQKAIKEVGCQLEGMQSFKLKDMSRCVIILRKIDHAPSKYPRPQNKPRKNPIN